MGSWDAGPCYPKLLYHGGSFVRVPPGTARKDAGLERRLCYPLDKKGRESNGSVLMGE